jgi:hypothetical protein
LFEPEHVDYDQRHERAHASHAQSKYNHGSPGGRRTARHDQNRQPYPLQNEDHDKGHSRGKRFTEATKNKFAPHSKKSEQHHGPRCRRQTEPDLLEVRDHLAHNASSQELLQGHPHRQEPEGRRANRAIAQGTHLIQALLLRTDPQNIRIVKDPALT